MKENFFKSVFSKAKDKAEKAVQVGAVVGAMSMPSVAQDSKPQTFDKQIDGISQQDQSILEKHSKLASENSHYYVKDGNEVKAVIRASLSHLKESFPTSETLRSSIEQNYNNVLNAEEIENLHSFITRGQGSGEDKAINQNDVAKLQSIYNKLASSADDSSNDKLPEILESNSKEEGGIDNKLGKATTLASNSLHLEIAKALDYARPKEVPESNYEVSLDELNNKVKETPLVNIDAPQEKGKTAFILEKGFSFSNEKVKQIELFSNKLNFDSSSLDDAADFVREFNSSKFDKVNIDGKTTDFGEIGDIGKGAHKIQGNGFISQFELSDNSKSNKVVENFSITDGNGLSASFDKAVKNNTKEGEYAFAMDNVNVGIYGSSISLDKIRKYENPEEIDCRIDGLNIKIGGWNLDVGYVDAKYQTEKGNVKLQDLVKDVIHGENGVTAGSLIEKFGVGFGTIHLKNDENTFNATIENNKYIINGNEIFRDSDGNFNIKNLQSGDGAKYNKSASSFVKLDGQNLTLGAFVDRLASDTEVLIKNNHIEAGVSALGGALSFKTGIDSKFTQEKLNEIGEYTDKKFQGLEDSFNKFTGNLEGKTAKDLVNMGIDLKKDAVEALDDIAGKIIRDGDIKLKDWEFSLDFKKLSDNFELTGHKDARNSLYDLDVFLAALGNDLSKVTINQEFIDGYKNAPNKGDFISKKLGFGNTIQEGKDRLNDRIKEVTGEDANNLSAENTLGIVGAVENGFTKGIVISDRQVAGYFGLIQNLSKLRGRSINIIGNANFAYNGGIKQQNFSKLINSEGKEHLGLSTVSEVKAHAGLIFTKIISSSKETGVSTQAIAQVGASLVDVEDFNVAFSDGNGGIYKLPDLDKALELLDPKSESEFTKIYTEIREKKETNKIIPDASLGLTAQKDFGNGLVAKAGALGSYSVGTGAINFNWKAAVEKTINTKFAPITVGTQVNYGTQKGKPFFNGMNGKIYLQVPISGYKTKYKK